MKGSFLTQKSTLTQDFEIEIMEGNQISLVG